MEQRVELCRTFEDNRLNRAFRRRAIERVNRVVRYGAAIEIELPNMPFQGRARLLG